MQKQEKEDTEQMAQQEAANQKMQPQQDTHTAANRQQQAEVRLNLYNAASVVMHLLPIVVGAGPCLLQVTNSVHNILNISSLCQCSGVQAREG